MGKPPRLRQGGDYRTRRDFRFDPAGWNDAVASGFRIILVRRQMLLSIGMQFEPHGIEDGEGASQSKSEYPAEIPHGKTSGFRDRGLGIRDA